MNAQLLGLDHTLQIPWNNLAALRAVFEAHGDQFAAVICEPVMANACVVAPADGQLEELRALCDRYGAWLIFDEVITGFRVGSGGAQKRYGVSCVVVRILDPARAELYADLGMRTVCPTSGAIDVLSETVLSHTAAI